MKTTIRPVGYKGARGEFDDETGKLIRMVPEPEPKQAKFPVGTIIIALLVAAFLVWAAVKESNSPPQDVSARDGVK
jgi:hypothetical protein